MRPLNFRSALTRLFAKALTPHAAGRRRRGFPGQPTMVVEQLEARQLLASQATLSKLLGANVTLTFNGDQTPIAWKSMTAGQLEWVDASGDPQNAGLAANFKTFCSEISQSVSTGVKSNFDDFTQALDSVPTGVANEQVGRDRANRLTAFWQQYGPTDMNVGFTNATSAAAFQLGMWEILNEVQGGNLDLAQGRFQVAASQQSSAAVVQARQWLQGLNTSLAAQSNVVISTLTSPTRQNQVTVTPKPPTPGEPKEGCPCELCPISTPDAADGLVNPVVRVAASAGAGKSANLTLQRLQPASGQQAGTASLAFQAAATGAFGNGWSRTASPTLAVYGSDVLNPDYVALVFHGSDTRLFRNVPSAGQPKFYLATGQGTTDSFTLAGGEYVFRTASGETLTFHDFDPSRPASQRGQLISRTDASGNALVFSFGTGGVTQLTSWTPRSGGGADLVEIQDYTLLPSGDPNAGKVSRIDIRRGDGVLVRSVALEYHDGTSPQGTLGDLAQIETFDPAGNLLDAQAYRYLTSAGGASLIKYSLDFDSVRRVRAAGLDVGTAPDAAIAPYATNYYEYDAQHRVTRHDQQGAGCSSCTSGIGTFLYAYSQNPNPVYGSNHDWRFKTTETRPDGSQRIVYSNALTRPMLEVLRTDDGGVTRQFGTYTRYNAQGDPIWQATPEAVALPANLATLEQYPDLLNEINGNFQYLNDSTGLINVTSYFGTTTATATTAGGVERFVSGNFVMRGDRGTPLRQQAFTYFVQAAGSDAIFPVATQTTYPNTTTSGAQTTTYSYTFAPGTTRLLAQRTTRPVISTSQNGPGTPDSSDQVFDLSGRETWSRDADGFLQFTRYDSQTGGVLQRIVDVDTSRSADFQDLPAGWVTPAGGGLHLISTFEVDALGRTTRRTDPLGNVTFTVYDDSNHATRTYEGWNAATSTPTGPIQVSRRDLSGTYTESLTFAGVPTVDSQGRPTGQEPITNIQSLSRSHVNSAGQVVAGDSYTNLAGLVYSTDPTLGDEGTHYLRTRSAYNNRGEIDRVQNPAGTITHSVYDGLSRLVGTWIGTDDSTTNGFKWTPTNGSVTSNMTQVAAYEFDNGGVGNGNLTRETQFPGGGAEPRVTQHGYDWRNRRVATKSAASATPATEDSTVNRPLQFQDLDNLGRVTGSRVYDGDGVSLADLNGDGVPDQPSASSLRASSVTLYDSRDRPYRTQQLFVDQATGAVGTPRLTTNQFRDRRGNVVASYDPNGPVSQTRYDGAGRLTATYILGNAPSATWANATSLAASLVLEQSEFTYDTGGNTILRTNRQRFHDAPTTALGPLGTPTSGISARVSYTASYYDLANRLTASVDVGTNGGLSYVRPGTAPARSDTALVTDYTHDAAGRVQGVTDPRGIVSRTLYDALGRTTATIANFTGGTPAAQTDVTTLFTFDSAGRLAARTAVQPAGTPSQVTGYVYGVSPATGSTITSNDHLAETRYPDPSTGLPSASERDRYTVNGLGEQTSRIDRAGTTHEYAYDVTGRQTGDAVSTLGVGVDGTVRRMETAYDVLERVRSITTFSAATGGSALSEVRRDYNGFGQVTSEWQSHTGLVDPFLTPRVQTAYSEGSGGNHSRPTRVTYPDGYQVNYVYSGTDSAVSRLTSLSGLRLNTTTAVTLESFKYLGAGTMIERSRPEVNVTLSMVNFTGTTADAGDKYTGLDRFGRVVDQRWTKGTTATSPVMDRSGSTYDRNSNRLTRTNALASAFSETYTYDALNQLQTFQRAGGATNAQQWQFDALGNWTSLTTNGVTQNRTANAQNELTQVGSSALAYSNTGNLTTDAEGRGLIYDAWNRLVSVRNGAGVEVARYGYDGLNRRIVEQVGTLAAPAAAAAPVRDNYYSGNWQVLEERVRGLDGTIPTTAESRFLWSPVYIDAMIARDRNADGNLTTGVGGLEQRIYVLQDANWNTTALIAATGVPGVTAGNIIQRFVYTPYGESQVLSAAWLTPSASVVQAWSHLFQGLELTDVTGLAYVRHRDYSATLGRFVELDPIGFSAGDNNWYRFVANGPLTKVDPSGFVLIVWAIDDDEQSLAELNKILTQYNEEIDMALKHIKQIDFDNDKGRHLIKWNNKPFKGTKQDYTDRLEREKHSRLILGNPGNKAHDLEWLSKSVGENKDELNEDFDQALVLIHGLHLEGKWTGNASIGGAVIAQNDIKNEIDKSGLGDKWTFVSCGSGLMGQDVRDGGCLAPLFSREFHPLNTRQGKPCGINFIPLRATIEKVKCPPDP